MGYGSIYERDLYLDVEKSVLKKRVVRHNGSGREKMARKATGLEACWFFRDKQTKGMQLSYAYGYLGIGAIFFILSMAFHQLTKEDEDNWFEDMFMNPTPNGSRWFWISNNIFPRCW